MFSKAMLRSILVIAFLFALNACVSFSPKALSPSDSSYCEYFYQSFDDLVDKAGVHDAQAAIVDGFPFLSVNRFLVSFKQELNTTEKFQFWLSWLAKLNLQARDIEWKNLPQHNRTEFSKYFLQNTSFQQQLQFCSTQLSNNIDSQKQKKLIAQISVPENYSQAKRVLGLYPVSSLFVSNQIDKHQKTTREQFSLKLERMPVKGQLKRYAFSGEAVNFTQTHSVPLSADNPLDIPNITGQELNDLFKQYAPILEIDEHDFNDKPGSIYLDQHGSVMLDVEKPVAYLLPSFTRFKNQILLQLNYVFWFPSRPKISWFDIYGGHLDGLIWRVTLNENGKPIAYDSIHACGCYHKFYINEALEFNESLARQQREPPFVAQVLSAEEMAISPVIRLSSGEHYVQRVYPLGENEKSYSAYSMKSYDDLRSLSVGDEFKSLFEANALVSGSERAERWLLWPMGVLSAGAMRQWGNHAVAFVGKRHFDDPYLFDRYFNIK